MPTLIPILFIYFSDIEQVLHKLFSEGIPPLVLVGHSMGGAVAVRVSLQPSLEHCIHGIAVIDVVEGIHIIM